jgi:hypothetical protein
VRQGVPVIAIEKKKRDFFLPPFQGNKEERGGYDDQRWCAHRLPRVHRIYEWTSKMHALSLSTFVIGGKYGVRDGLKGGGGGGV